MLNTLTNICCDDDGEEAGGLRLLTLDDTEELILDLLFMPLAGKPTERWRIACSGVRGWVMHQEHIGSIEVYSEHPVLLPFADTSSALFFSNPAPDPAATNSALADRHYKLLGDWIPFHRFFNALSGGVSNLLSTRAGMLASGPTSLLSAYQDVLTQNQIRSSLIDSPTPLYWNGGKWIEQTEPLYALILGESYVVAEDFSEQRI